MVCASSALEPMRITRVAQATAEQLTANAALVWRRSFAQLSAFSLFSLSLLAPHTHSLTLTNSSLRRWNTRVCHAHHSRTRRHTEWSGGALGAQRQWWRHAPTATGPQSRAACSHTHAAIRDNHRMQHTKRTSRSAEWSQTKRHTRNTGSEAEEDECVTPASLSLSPLSHVCRPRLPSDSPIRR